MEKPNAQPNHDPAGLTRSDGIKDSESALEAKVRERTRELARINEELRMEMAEHLRSMEIIRKSKELSDALNKLSAIIHSTLDLNEKLRRVVEGAAVALRADGAMIGLFEEGAFRVRHACNMPSEFSRRRLISGELRALLYAAGAGNAVAFNNAASDDRLNRQFVREMGIQSMIVAPIVTRDTTAGIMAFYGLSRRIDFSDEQIDFTGKLGASVSLALENARLYNTLEESQKLSESRFAELHTIYETAPVGLCFIDRNKRFISINRQMAELNGISIEETIGRPIHHVNAAYVIEDLSSRAMETGRPVENIEITGKAKDGPEMTVLTSCYPIRDRKGAMLGVNVMVQDITQRKQVEQALQESERRSKAILNSIPDIAWLKDREGRYILVNDSFGLSAGKDPDELIGKTDFDIRPRHFAEKVRADDHEVMKSRFRKRIEEDFTPAHGAPMCLETIITPVLNEQGEVTGTVGIARDITSRKRMEEEIRHMAQHDALTGLPNRRLFIDIVEIELARARRRKGRTAILFLDLDRFKEINDTLGHDFGDMLLQQMADRIRKTIRESDTVARIGGDEFNIVLSHVERYEDISDIARKIISALREPVFLDGHELHITASIGISIYPDDGEEIENLLRFADIAMYFAKESGRNTFRFYNPSINIRSIERMKLENRLRRTIARGELAIRYQPQIDVGSKKITHVEALVRWNHPERGLLEPKDFLPLAEETGFITAIDRWVLRTVCAQARVWKEGGMDKFCVTVNLSSRQFQNPDLVKMISTALAEARLSPSSLDIEVTENTAMGNIERTASQLRELSSMGVHISIDDFGTGYSSLSYLKKLPIDRIKIDRSFVQDIAKSPDDRAIISAVISMARQMGIRTVAEGVETEEQFTFVKEAGCDEVQGFLVSEPVSAERFRELIASM